MKIANLEKLVGNLHEKKRIFTKTMHWYKHRAKKNAKNGFGKDFF